MILDADAHAKLLARLCALAQVGGDPLLNLLSATSRSDLLPSHALYLRVREDTDDWCAQTRGDLDPFFNVLHGGGADRLIRGGKIIAHTRAADANSQVG